MSIRAVEGPRSAARASSGSTSSGDIAGSKTTIASGVTVTTRTVRAPRGSPQARCSALRCWSSSIAEATHGPLATIAILPADASAEDPTVRFDREIEVDVAGGEGSYVLVAAYGDAPLEPVHRDRVPFGVTNPIFLHR
jgi:hypothetical protein